MDKKVLNNYLKDQKEPPKQKGVPGLFSRFTFAWFFPIFYNGYKRDLEEYDLRPTQTMYESKVCGDKLERQWLEEEAYAKASGRQPSFTRVLFRTFIWSYLPGGIMQAMYVTLRTTTPLLFSELLGYWSSDSATSREMATYYAVAMIFCNVVGAMFNHHGNLFCQQFGLKLRVATSSLMFRKIMRMNNGSLGETTAGKVVNLLSNDLQRFDFAFLFLHYLWILPIQLSVVCYLGYLQAGYAALIGLAAMLIISIPIQSTMSRVTGFLRGKIAVRTDARIKLMSEVINGIQVIKMYAWELPFQKMVGEKRNLELKKLQTATFLKVIFQGFVIFTERFALFLTILTYVIAFGNPMSANVIYPLQQFMSAAQINITIVLPLILLFSAELFVTLGRVQEFLLLEDRPDLITTVSTKKSNLFKNMSNYGNDENKDVRPVSYQPRGSLANIKDDIISNGRKYRRSVSHPSDFIVEVKDVSASWTNNSASLALKNVSLRIKKNRLYAIIGSVGSGKSSFLQLLLKELSPLAGTVSVHGSVSYASQEAWLFPSTVRENILFGLPYDKKKYRKVCKVCALEKDFKQFPYGDQSLVGERGVSLSGGQRARINLARAVYRESDLYLLDDPLSAVDANVGRELFEGCINGYLRGHTRVLVTHQVHFLKAADYIIVLNDGQVECMGTFGELLSSNKNFSLLMQERNDIESPDCGALEKTRPSFNKQVSTLSTTEEFPQFEPQKMAAEERASGNLRWSVITQYFTSGSSYCFVMFTFMMVLLAPAFAATADYWVSYWSNQMAAYEEELGEAEIDPGLNVQVGNFTTGQYIIIHGCIALACIIAANLRAIPFTKLCISSSRAIHEMMFSSMLRGIMRFFDTSSSGRILNRFTKDMGALDDILPRTIIDMCQIFFTFICILILNAIALYWTLIPTFFLTIVFLMFLKVYIKAAQGIKRIEGTTKSPVFSMVTSTLSGIATIRSSGAQQRLMEEFDNYQDLNTSAYNGYLCGGSGFGMYLDFLCQMYLTVVIFVFLYLDFGDAFAVGSVGLAVTQSNTLTAMLQHAARQLVEFLGQLTSVERVLEYTRIEQEENLFQGLKPTPPQWPSEGQIVFNDVVLRYAPDEAPVLKNLNINIQSGWKVGIVGRTGAGKSSLISALFRFSYIDGTIAIDGLDTAMLAKQQIRSRISIIPQEPVLFSASIRYNLDPFDVYSDDDLWRALEQVDLKSVIPSLDFKVTEGGANFSVGQRQLMCLARAVLRSNKILIMDEATANVDPQTDNFIQQTIRTQFANCTVLTIAHRLNTIMDSDRVLVMDSGQIAEFDHPFNLLSNPNSHFSSMVRETGDKNASQLFQVANNAFLQNNMKENCR